MERHKGEERDKGKDRGKRNQVLEKKKNYYKKRKNQFLSYALLSFAKKILVISLCRDHSHWWEL